MSGFPFVTQVLGESSLPRWTGQNFNPAQELKSSASLPDGVNEQETASLSRNAQQHPAPVAVKRSHSEEFMHFELGRNINEKTEVEHQIEKLCVKKSELSFFRLFFLGTLSGIWMTCAASFANMVAAGVDEELKDTFPAAHKLIVGLLAPVAMHFIVVFGGEFYSGNTMYFCVGLFKKRVTLRQALHNWFWVFIWNAFGIVVSCFFFTWLSGIFKSEPQLSYIIAGAEAKAKLSWDISFARSIPANILICTSIQMGISARDMTGKIVALHIPLTVYTIAGFEHCITNIVVVTFGVMHGAKIDFIYWFFNNLLPSTIGNLIGGGLIVGGAVTLLYSWDEEHGNTNMAPIKGLEEAVEKMAKVPMTVVRPVLKPVQKAAGSMRDLVLSPSGRDIEMSQQTMPNSQFPSAMELDRTDSRSKNASQELEDVLTKLAQAKQQLQETQDAILASRSAEIARSATLAAAAAYQHAHERSLKNKKHDAHSQGEITPEASEGQGVVRL